MTAQTNSDNSKELAGHCAVAAAQLMEAMLHIPVQTRLSGERHFTDDQAFELTKIFLKLAIEDAGV